MIPPTVLTDFATGELRGPSISTAERTVGDLAGYWLDDDCAMTMSGELLYRTQTWFPVEDNTEGAVLWGNTTLMPGRVGDEFFMTRGHWHVKRDRCEICMTVSGRGSLLLMGDDRQTVVQEMVPGSTHYIPGTYAHRTVNTGDEPLVFLCAWPADCGHEYESILRDGFSQRLLA